MGCKEGCLVGCIEGKDEGCEVGFGLGETVGFALGLRDTVGDGEDGTSVGESCASTTTCANGIIRSRSSVHQKERGIIFFFFFFVSLL